MRRTRDSLAAPSLLPLDQRRVNEKIPPRGKDNPDNPSPQKRCILAALSFLRRLSARATKSPSALQDRQLLRVRAARFFPLQSRSPAVAPRWRYGSFPAQSL